ncbi:hypothetical protein J40TS1_05340 [Paenibacillus montaniterrae]|uniref:Uncharacterized protein n=1 Tax=Paenibacillus montaniterrae TaxID=429341 RepID=A0A919YKC9_9BACL|nr:hypothetical protein J40TS1_05340 [Paenibacillus montaniterrae]
MLGVQRSVGTYYESTEAFGSVTYSKATKLQRSRLVIKVGFLTTSFNEV